MRGGAVERLNFADERAGFALVLQRLKRWQDGVEAFASAVLEKGETADGDGAFLDRGLGAFAGHGLEVGGSGEFEAAIGGGDDNGMGDRVFGS